ncbi:hypothetical protein NDN08_000359 [Rhodosorus marinus]|uniref:Protein kinase domain-containing protein n=1 Tax=Rhodosorus marinus TaxID=101924 RepID=A0AAV8UQQ7_9RHOD|nr:hypothetical protein NDN08_000359 [Rhodosorus marinus]
MSDSAHVESDPTGRYSRTERLLGRGSFKLVYKGFDNEDAVEVAWNKLQTDRLTEQDILKVAREVDFLQLVNHKNIINFFAQWRGTTENGKPKMDFITEMMTSGTLKDFIRNAKHIRLKVIRRWSLNILEAIAYLHSFQPPIMHRDLKCENIFINGHVGEVKIGDLGLSSVKEKEKAYTVLGTPQFMAPELYEEEYTEKVDIYAFGMCMLEMLTMEYPYGECQNTAQIFRKVLQGEPPAALLKLVDSEFKEVISKCLKREEHRPTAEQLLEHPLFRDWTSDDGRLSNVDLIRTDQGALQVPKTTALNNVTTADMYVHHSPNLERDVVITGPGDDANNEAVTTERGSIRIGLRVPVDGELKNIAFMFDPEEDSAQDIANEMLLEFQLDEDQVEQIRKDIEEQLQGVTDSGKEIVPPTQLDSGIGIMIGNTAQGLEAELVSDAIGNGDGFSAGVGSHLPRTGNANAGQGKGSTSTSQSSARIGSRVNSSPSNESVHNSKTFNLCMQLMNDCAAGRLPEAKARIAAGASPSFSDYDKRTPMHLAASEGHAGIVELLVLSGANPLETDRWGSTPLNDALKNERDEVVAVLEKHGVARDDVDTLTSGEFASMELLEFAARGLHDLVRERLVAGVSAQFADYDKRTPLHLAASEGHTSVAELLLVNGASMEVKDRFGRTPIDDAIKNGNKDVLRIMKQYGGEVPAKLLDARASSMERFRGMDLIDHAAKGRYQKVKGSLDSGVDINYRDYDGRTALHLSASEGHLHIVDVLIQRGAKLNIKDRWGSTPYDEAEKRSHVEAQGRIELAGGVSGAELGNSNSPHSNISPSDSQEDSGASRVDSSKLMHISSLHAMSLQSEKISEVKGVDKYV